MALIKCSECGKEISSKADSCVNCGAPVEIEEMSEAEATRDLIACKVTEVNTRLNDSWVFKVSDDGGRIYIVSPEVELIADSFERDIFKFRHGDKVFIQLARDGRETVEKIFYYKKNSDHKKKSGSNIDSGEGAITRGYLKYLVVALLVGAYWIAKGTPAPSLFFSGAAAERQCLQLAEENRGNHLLIDTAGELRADSSWVSEGRRVVRLIQYNEEGFRQIMCLYGNGMVTIPSALEQGRWR